jgi:anti-anti-sigma factor
MPLYSQGDPNDPKDLHDLQRFHAIHRRIFQPVIIEKLQHGRFFYIENKPDRGNAHMNLDVDIWKKEEGYYLIVLNGRLDRETYEFCERKLEPILDTDIRVLTFDMSNLSYISSMGLRVFLKARKTIEGKGGKVLTANLQPQIAKIFEIVAALPKQHVFASIKEADAYFDAIQKKEIEERNK